MDKMHNIHSKMNHVYGIYSKILITFNMYNAICGVSVVSMELLSKIAQKEYDRKLHG